MSTTAARVRDVFDDWARRGRAEGMERGHGPAARQAFERLRVGPATRYLDIGCGNGYTVRWAAAVAPGVRALGIDVSPEMIEQARRATTDRTNADFRCATFPDAALADASFDAIFSMEVFYYLADLDAGLRDVRRLLADGGRFACIVDFYGENAASHSWPEELGLSLQLRSATEWARAFEDADLRVVEQARLRPPLGPDEQPTWKHTEGSLLTVGEAAG